MGKKKTKGEYNDFTEDTRYQTNNDMRTTLQSTSTLTRNISPPTSSTPSQHRNNTHNKTKAKKPPLTHFLCFPLVTSTNRDRLSQALEELKNDVQKVTPVPPKAVRPIGTLHLTLGVMSLSSEQLNDATKHLKELDIGKLLRGITTQQIASIANDTPTVSEGFGAVENPTSSPSNPALQADPDKLVIELRGLVPMQSPRSTSILYAEPKDQTGRLLHFGESLRSSFEEHGWIVHDDRALRLHATVLNTIYAKLRGRGRGKGTETLKSAAGAGAERDAGADGVEQSADGEVDKPERRSDAHALNATSWTRFDASNLIDAYKDFIWAEDVRIDRVQICKMGAQKIVDEVSGKVVDERYEVVAEKSM